MEPLHFLIGIHDHQPWGNFGHVFEKAWEEAYGPFFEAVDRHPGVRFSLHLTGALLEWIEVHRPEALETFRGWVEQGRVEMIGGAFYEPIVTAIPRRDARGQIGLMREYLERHVGARPEGMWLAERVWRPDVPAVVEPAGVRYAILDDTHFRHAGLPEQDLHGYFLTESGGHPLALFPIDKGLRYTIPFRAPEETIERLRDLHRRGQVRAVTYADDGEKFGLWPGTHEWVYAQGWLDRFLGLLEESSDWLRLSTFSEALALLRPTGRVYPPTASYDEMTEWALPPEAQRDRKALEVGLREAGLLEPARAFLRGGHWDSFLSRYPEVNYLHKRMLEVSRRLGAAEDAGIAGLEEARRALYRAQVNCPYWHGLFGGLYLNGIRQEVYRNLILAERCLAEAGRRPPLLERRDLDLEGDEEIIVRGSATGAVLKPALGGGLVELDVHQFPFNLLDVVTRREEAYHDDLARASTSASEPEAEAGEPASIHDRPGQAPADLAERLALDHYRRLSALDRMVAPGLRAAGSRRGAEGGERGGPPDLSYTVEEVEETGRRVRVRLSARRPCHEREIRIEKTLHLDPDAGRYRIELRLECEGEGALPALYAQEWNLTLLAPDARDRRVLVNGRTARPARMNAETDHREVVELALEDGWSGIRAAFCPDRPVRLQRYPIETISRSEQGFEATYQGTCLLFVWPDPPAGGSVFEAALDLILTRP